MGLKSYGILTSFYISSLHWNYKQNINFSTSILHAVTYIWKKKDSNETFLQRDGNPGNPVDFLAKEIKTYAVSAQF